MEYKKFNDERFYLLPYRENGQVDWSLIEKIYELADERQIIVKNNYINNLQRINLYDEYTNLVAKLIMELGIKGNSISYLEIMKVLIRTGLFSYNNRLVFEGPYMLEMKGYSGLQIVTGRGCCRHISNFCRDVLVKTDVECDLGYGVCRKFKDFDFPYTDWGNHAINIICYDGIYYGYDITQGQFYKFVDELRMEAIFSQNERSFFLKPYLNMILDNESFLKINQKLDEYFSCAHMESITDKEFMEIRRDTRDRILFNEDCLLDFWNDSQEYTRKLILK